MTFTKDNREYKLYTETFGFELKFFFYTEDDQPRDYSHWYASIIIDIEQAIPEAWTSFVNGHTWASGALVEGVKSEFFTIGPPAFQPTPVETEIIDDKRNEALDKLETLPTELYFEVATQREQ